MEQVTTQRALLAARRLHAEIYLSRNFVTAEEIDSGMLNVTVDPWVDHSTYFLATDDDGRAVGVSRQIRAADVVKLPSMRLEGLDSDVREHVRRQPVGSVVEISALAARAGAPPATALSLYSAMWRASLKEAHRAWLMSVHPQVHAALTSTLGPVLARLGPRQWYLGSDVLPAVLWTDTAAVVIHAHALRRGDARQALILPALFPPSPHLRSA